MHTFWITDKLFLEVGNDGVDFASLILWSISDDCTVIFEASLFGFYFLIGY